MVCLDPLDVAYGTKMELLGMLNGCVTVYVSTELSAAERARSLPWSMEQENAVRGAYLGSQVASGAYPRLAAAFAEDSGPIDMEAVFERMLDRVLDGFEPREPSG
jgi:hypothetical protein